MIGKRCFLISILPLRGEWDCQRWRVHLLDFEISILPLRGEWDDQQRQHPCSIVISILPLRGEWDSRRYWSIACLYHFNPPTPWGVGRPDPDPIEPVRHISILPLRGEWDAIPTVDGYRLLISILPLRGEWDLRDYAYHFYLLHFNPPTPWGVGLATPPTC